MFLCQERTTERRLLRQRDEFHRSQPRTERAAKSVRQESTGRRVVLSVIRGEVQLHTSSSAAFRRTREAAIKQAKFLLLRQHGAHARTNGNNACRIRGDDQQSSNCTAISGPQRRRRLDTSSSTITAFVADRTHRRCERQGSEVMHALYYILGLQNKTKWHQGMSNLEEGQVVIIHEDKRPPQKWLTGRVWAVIKGEDGKIRVELETASINARSTICICTI